MTPNRFVIRAAAKRDLAGHFAWLEAEAGVDVAERYLESAETSFARLAETPGLGPEVKSRRVELTGLRKWRIDGFASQLIFYIPRQSGVLIVRVLHAAQDWMTLLDSD